MAKTPRISITAIAKFFISLGFINCSAILVNSYGDCSSGISFCGLYCPYADLYRSCVGRVDIGWAQMGVGNATFLVCGNAESFLELNDSTRS